MKEGRGYALILGASLFWGTSATAAKLLLQNNVDTILIVQTRVTFSVVLMLAWFGITAPRLLRIHVRDIWRFALLGIAGVAGANFAYYYAIRESTVATAILLQYTAPVLVMGYAVVMREERITPVKAGAAFLSLAGCVLAVTGRDVGAVHITRSGLLAGMLASACFAYLNIYTRHLLARYSAWTVTVYSLLGASLFWLVINPPWRVAMDSSSPWGALVLFAIMSILIPHSLYFNGLRFVVPSRAVITSTFEPVVAIVSAAVILGDFLDGLQVLGAFLVIAAIILLQLRREESRVPTPGESRHA